MEDITVDHRNPVLPESICEPISLVDKTNLFVHGVQVMTISNSPIATIGRHISGQITDRRDLIETDLNARRKNALRFQVVFDRPIGGDDKDPGVVEVITELEISQKDDAK